LQELPPDGLNVAAEVTRIAAAPGRTEQRTQSLLHQLHRVVPFQGAWISLLDPEAREQPPLVFHGYPDALRDYMGGPAGVAEIEMLGLNRSRGATRLCDLPVQLEEVPSWAEYLAPAGFRGGVAAGLFTPDGRYLGMLALNTDTMTQPTTAARDLISRLTPMIADAIDPMRSLSAAVRIIRNAGAAVVLTRAGNTLPLPGLPGHPLLSSGSDVLMAVSERLADGNAHATFLCLLPGGDAGAGHTRVTFLACSPGSPNHLTAVVAISPAGDLRGLTGRELEILGLLVDDWPDQRIAAALDLPLLGVAERVEHILIKLRAPTRIVATLRALRLGLYVPRSLSGSGE
jgi:DNA-binding CsgD family transcriptional regulator